MECNLRDSVIDTDEEKSFSPSCDRRELLIEMRGESLPRVNSFTTDRAFDIESIEPQYGLATQFQSVSVMSSPHSEEWTDEEERENGGIVLDWFACCSSQQVFVFCLLSVIFSLLLRLLYISI